MKTKDHAALLEFISDEDLAAEITRRKKLAQQTLDVLREPARQVAVLNEVASFSDEAAALVKAAAGIFLITPGEILGQSREVEIVEARHCVFLALFRRGRSYNSIARLWKVNHVTVMHGCLRAITRNETNSRHLAAFEQLEACKPERPNRGTPMNCPHCTQGYVQDSGFTECNHCRGTGALPPVAGSESLAIDALRKWDAVCKAAEACNTEMESLNYDAERWEALSQEHARLMAIADDARRVALATLNTQNDQAEPRKSDPANGYTNSES